MLKEELDVERVFVIHHLLSEEECAALIRRSEATAYEPGTVAGVVNENFRSNLGVQFRYSRTLTEQELRARQVQESIDCSGVTCMIHKTDHEIRKRQTM